MPLAVADTSVLLFLYRIQALHLLGALFERILIPDAVVAEMSTAERLGHAVLDMNAHDWIEEVSPLSVPPEWLGFDLGPGELGVPAVAMENPECVALLDDRLSRRIARAAGLSVWGTMKVLLEAKRAGEIAAISPLVDRLIGAGMWISDDMRQHILVLANEVGS